MSDKEKITMYSVKYWQTDGVVPLIGVLLPADQDGCEVEYFRSDNYWANLYRTGRDVFSTREEAVDRAKVLKDKKILSLKKTIKKLESMSFDK